MAADVGDAAARVDQPAAEPSPDTIADAGYTPHRFRFLTIYGILGLALGVGAAALAIGLTSHGASRSSSSWSTWQPTGGGLGAAEQIAQHVAAQYRLPNDAQLDDVIAKAPSVTVTRTTYTLGYIALRGTNGSADQVLPISGSNSVMYTLCGLGTACTISSGAPSVARGRVVLREILELALYTFHYDRGVDSVIALMPPRSAVAAPTVIYLRRGDLAAELSRPLGRTLSPQAPSASTMSAREQQFVDEATAGHSYSFSLARAQDGNTILILSPLAA